MLQKFACPACTAFFGVVVSGSVYSLYEDFAGLPQA
jgi:hypothetical protein